MNVMRVSILAVAVVAGGAAWMLARGIESGPGETVVRQTTETEQVLVAARDIKPGTGIVEADLRWDVWPRDSVSADYLDRAGHPDAMSALAGSVARGSLVAGEPVRLSRFIQAGRGGYLSAILPPGRRAVSMRTSPQTGAGGFILPNDRVDVILIRPDTGTLDPATEAPLRFSSQRLLENVRVLAIDQTVEEQDGRQVVIGSVATLELTPEQADALARGTQLGELSLALRSVLDGAEQVETAAPQRSRSVNVVKFGTSSRVGVN